MTLASSSVREDAGAENNSLAGVSDLTTRPLWKTGRLFDVWMGSYRAEIADQPKLELFRVVDLVGASIILVIVLPSLVILSVCLKLDSSGPLFYVQRRIGFGGREFPCLKFRTMVQNADVALQRHLLGSSAARLEWEKDHKLRRDPRITRIGAVLRKLSLDEFPQLINIIRGEMSLVGPRPIVAAEISRYGRYFKDYCEVRPGLTGLWQVSGRNNVTYRKRVSIDCYYVRNKSLVFDFMILLRTIPVVLGAKGSY